MTSAMLELDRKIALDPATALSTWSSLAEDALLAAFQDRGMGSGDPSGQDAADVLSLLTEDSAGRWVRRLDTLSWQLALDPRRALPEGTRLALPLGGLGIRVQDNYWGRISRRSDSSGESTIGSAFVCGARGEVMIPCLETVACPADVGDLPVGTIVRVGPAAPGMGYIGEMTIAGEPAREPRR